MPNGRKGRTHSIEASSDNHFVLAADLGLDELLVYRFDANRGPLAPSDPPFAKVAPGAGPRHFAFAPSGRVVYLVYEMGSSVSAFSYDPSHGKLNPLQTISTLPKDFKRESDAAEIEVSPSGKFLYASNCGHDSIALFSIDDRSGTLTPVEHVPTGSKTPRHFAIDPTSSHLVVANQDSDNLVVLGIDPSSGRLKRLSEVSGVSSPVCLTLLAHPGAFVNFLDLGHRGSGAPEYLYHRE
jgi:6-phosphogluconolactonase